MSTVAVDGVELFYKEQGSGSPVLLIHGTAGNADLWGEVFDALTVDRRVLAYDRRGFSRSHAQPVMDLHRHGEDAAALLVQLQAKPATVVGWSAGGIVALDLAVHHPELVSSLVLYEPTLYLRKYPQFSFLKDFFKVLAYRWMGRERRANEEFLRFALAYTTGGSAFDRVPEAWRQAMLDNSAASLYETDAGTGEYLSASQLTAISCPVTCLVGTLSQPFYLAAGRRITQLIPEAKLQMVAGAGHCITFDRPAALVDALT